MEGSDPQRSPITRLSGVQEKNRGLIVERWFGSGLDGRSFLDDAVKELD